MRLAVDRRRCMAAGECALTAPELFEQDAAGVSRPLVEVVPSDQEELAEEAVLGCPGGAIRAEA